MSGSSSASSCLGVSCMYAADGSDKLTYSCSRSGKSRRKNQINRAQSGSRMTYCQMISQAPIAGVVKILRVLPG